MISIVLLGMLAGAYVATTYVLAGYSLWIALLIYSGVGVAMILSFVLVVAVANLRPSNQPVQNGMAMGPHDRPS